MSCYESKEAPLASSTFLGSFNMNGTPLSLPHARKWLQVDINNNDSNGVSARNADLVILSLQECPTSPTTPASMSTNDSFVSCIMTYDNAHHGNVDELIDVLNKTLSAEHKLMADLAMGEPPSSSSSKVSAQDRWYGFIRLIVYAKGEVLKRISQDNSSATLIPVFCPCGNKTNSSVSGEHAYAPNLSPDKGGVCLLIPCLSSIICSLHLAGTNKYNVAEEYFDAIRISQLNSIHSRLEGYLKERDHSTDGDFSDNIYRKFILGDLNFRCEKFCNVQEGDKLRGGKDFKAVYDVITKGESDAIQDLFWGNDRLVRLLHSKNPKRSVLLLKDVMDLIARCNFGGEGGYRQEDEVVLPTFTMKFNEDGIEKQKVYSDKRTPGWPDRILVTNNLFSSDTTGIMNSNAAVTETESIKEVGSCQDVTSSDHIPVYSYLTPVYFP